MRLLHALLPLILKCVLLPPILTCENVSSIGWIDKDKGPIDGTMDKDICLCLHINKTIVCTAQIGAMIVGIFPHITKFIHFDLVGLCLVELATLILVNHMIRVDEEVFDVSCWLKNTWSLGLV